MHMTLASCNGQPFTPYIQQTEQTQQFSETMFKQGKEGRMATVGQN